MINKIITNAILIFGLSLITISTASAAATISIGNGSAGVGGTVVVPLMINDVTGAGSVEVNLTYDPSVVIPVSITNSDFDLPPQDPPVNPESGYVVINAMQFADGLDGSVKIGDITLQAMGDGGESSPLNLTDVILQDMAMQTIPIDGVINEKFEVVVNNVNRAPAISGLVNQSGIAGAAWTYDISSCISDPDGDPLTVTVDDDNISVSGFVLTFNYTIAVEDKPVLITVTDAGGLSSSQTVFVTAAAPVPRIITNDPPILETIGRKKIYVGKTLSFTISASDTDGDILTFSASNMPVGASFNPDTQTFSWTPTSDQAGVYKNVHFEVSDGKLTDWENIMIRVQSIKNNPRRPKG